MALIDIPTVIRFGNRWALSRAFGTKWRQTRGVPQGINYGVGVCQLAVQRREHEYYTSHPEKKRQFIRARVIDDSIA